MYLPTFFSSGFCNSENSAEYHWTYTLSQISTPRLLFKINFDLYIFYRCIYTYIYKITKKYIELNGKYIDFPITGFFFFFYKRFLIWRSPPTEQEINYDQLLTFTNFIREKWVYQFAVSPAFGRRGCSVTYKIKTTTINQVTYTTIQLPTYIYIYTYILVVECRVYMYISFLMYKKVMGCKVYIYIYTMGDGECAAREVVYI